ncbi:MAG: site-specific integrase [Pseudodesulfovibrio sp.]|uniref:Integrase family protein n=1 Tax=Pseudodesulfovibrio aespoeensis (strain ATCC 700646 / DSM 10631 / Aspo-2) TaxID=643562 RepID=E6VX36_PSEA9|nr:MULTISPECIES: site-specific integrase [Pseudodesulfovibrio]MBU4378879.1 site-specific integrase [Pseudomonadota bacterium]MCG2742004.1 site-specific integrase [Syntrophaceae bacterium]ADU61442.1 integrase family protein [Pseudodesulfovibrio aespoeensis Aspo-2]MBU4475257.1 site-specific integrase [Pseudomonadota bacterium]MBU4516294.1 site-specific integrase [Pseudomonadota bacterium]
MTVWHKTDFPGVRYRKHKKRRHGVKYDQYFTITYKLKGKTKSEAIGWASHKVSAKECDDILRQLKANHRNCEGPQTYSEMKEAKQYAFEEERDVGSVEDLFEGYVDHLRSQNKTSWKEVARSLLTSRNVTPAADNLGRNRAANTISSRDIQRVLEQVHADAPSMAAHLRSYLHGAFAYGISREFDYFRPNQCVKFDLKANPVAVVPRNAAAYQPRNRFLSYVEIKLLWENMDKYCTVQTASFFRLVLAVGGQRVKEVLEAPFSEFNLEEMIWIIPGERTKNKREHVVPLTERAVSIIKSLKGESQYLFPKRWRPKETMPCTSINDIVKKFCAHEEVELWRPSDIRRTCRTHLSDAGCAPYLLNWHFNHGEQGVGEKHYDKSQHVAEKRLVMEMWDKLLKNSLEKQ